MYKPLKPKEFFEMFVKVGESHTLWKDIKTGDDNKLDTKPRLICCPSYVIRARIGLISYNILSYMKRLFP